MIEDYGVAEIQAQQILIAKEGELAIWKRMTHFFSTQKGDKQMKDKRKIYQDPWPQDWRVPKPQGTLMELLLILLIGIIAVLYLGYKYYIQTPPNPIEVQQEGSTLPADLTEGQGTPVIKHAVRNGNVTLFYARTQEYHDAVKKWQDWHKKFNELNALEMQAADMLIDALPTKEESKQHENDKSYRREVDRKAREALDKSSEIGAMICVHEAKNPLFRISDNSEDTYQRS